MAEEKLNPADEVNPPTEAQYESPKIEEVVTRDSLEREVFYAGVGSNGQIN